MAKDKDRAQNPATAHAKSEKAKALKKSRAALAVQRTERLSQRNPERLQRQLDELLAEEAASGGTLRPRDREAKEKLERDIKAVRGAREKLGGKDGKDGDRGVLGKRSRGDVQQQQQQRRGNTQYSHHQHRHNDNDAHASDASSATDPDVRAIPMPRDTPPPLPRRHPPPRQQHHQPHDLPARPTAPAQTTYSSAPQIRNLQKEATSAFVPAAVAARLKQARPAPDEHEHKLLELEEVEALERAGYLRAPPGARAGEEEEEEEERRRREVLEEEEKRFERELREAEEAGDEAVVEMMAGEEEEAGLRRGSSGTAVEAQGVRAERGLGRVQMEEVSDEDA